MKVILKNPSNSSWEELRPPAIINPAVFNLPEDQVLENPQVYDPYTSPFRGKKCVIINTENTVPWAEVDEARALAIEVNAITSQDLEGLSDDEKRIAPFSPYVEFGIEPPILDVFTGRTLGCYLYDSSAFDIEVIRVLQSILRKQRPLWRLEVNAGFKCSLQLTVYFDVVLIGESIVADRDLADAITSWQAAVRQPSQLESE